MKNETERFLIGKKVVLRRPRDEDFAEFIALNKASRRFHRNLAAPPLDEESFAEYLKRSRQNENETFLICQMSDDAIAGSIGLSQIFRAGFQNAYLGYFLGQKYVGRGYMTEAVALVLRYAFKSLKLHRIEANVQPENLASIAVLRRCGFRKEGFSEKYLKIGGRWRDHERWALIIENWKTNNGSKRNTNKK